MSVLRVILPPLSRCGGAPLLARMRARGSHSPDALPGYLPALADAAGTTAPLPVAALTRQHRAGDAGDAVWLCAEPAFVQPDMAGARMLACGNIDLDTDESEALAQALRPLFDDAGAVLETSTPSRWHLRLPAGSEVPALSTPEQAMGEDLLRHLPEGPSGRHWRLLMNEAQIIMHQHPVNAARQRRGQTPANSLWLWGAGRLPPSLHTALGQVFSDDELARALAQHAAVPARAADPSSPPPLEGDNVILLDLDGCADLARWWPWLGAAWRRARSVELFAASGERLVLRRWHRWRIWRRLP